MTATFAMKASPTDTNEEFDEINAAASNRLFANAKWSSLLIDSRPHRISFLSTPSTFISACLGPAPSLFVHGPSLPEDDDQFREVAKLALPSDPNDLVSLPIADSAFFVVPLVNGNVHIVKADENSRGGAALTEFARLETHTNGAEASSACVFEQTVFVGGSDGKIVALDASSDGRRTIIESGSGIECLSSLGGGSMLAAGNMGGMLNLWDLRATSGPSRPQFTVASKVVGDAVTAIAAHPAQTNILAVGYESGNIAFVDVRKGSEQPPEQKHSFLIAGGPITKIAFHPTHSDNLFVSSEDGSLVHWDAMAHASHFVTNSMVRQSSWLSPNLEASSQLNAISTDEYPGSVNSFAVVDDAIAIACDNQQIRVVTGLSLV